MSEVDLDFEPLLDAGREFGRRLSVAFATVSASAQMTIEKIDNLAARFLEAMEVTPDLEIRLYAAVRVATDPRVPLRFTGARFDAKAVGWWCEVGLYEPVFIGIEEIDRP